MSTYIEVFCFLLLGLLQYGLAKWVEGRVQESIRSEYAKILEDYKYDIRVREQAAKVAEFFTEWCKGNAADKAKLNRYSMELSLWLPPELYRKIGRCVTYTAGRPAIQDILIDVRKHLLKDGSGELKVNDIILFP